MLSRGEEPIANRQDESEKKKKKMKNPTNKLGSVTFFNYAPKPHEGKGREEIM